MGAEAEDPGAKAAKELLRKGIGNLQSLWQKAPSREKVWETLKEVAPESGPKFHSWAASDTFDRAPLSPGEFTSPPAMTSARIAEQAMCRNAEVHYPEEGDDI